MKKTFLTLVAAGAFLFSTQAATAQVTGEERAQANQEQQAQQQQDFQQIEAQELPDAVNQAVERDFQGATVAEAYKKEKDGQTKYRIVLQTENGEARELYADEQGNWVDKDDKQ